MQLCYNEEQISAAIKERKQNNTDKTGFHLTNLILLCYFFIVNVGDDIQIKKVCVKEAWDWQVF